MFEELLHARIGHRFGKGKLIKCFCLGLGRAVKMSTFTKKQDLHTTIREDWSSGTSLVSDMHHSNSLWVMVPWNNVIPLFQGNAWITARSWASSEEESAEPPDEGPSSCWAEVAEEGWAWEDFLAFPDFG
jgi:hypothetical protein